MFLENAPVSQIRTCTLQRVTAAATVVDGAFTATMSGRCGRTNLTPKIMAEYVFGKYGPGLFRNRGTTRPVHTRVVRTHVQRRVGLNTAVFQKKPVRR